jgi:hypothetical protein
VTRLSLLAALGLVVLQACDGSSPTAPNDIRGVDASNLVGMWAGPMPTGMPGEDWTSVTLSINHVGEGVAGYLRPRAGVDHPVTVTLSPGSSAGISVQPPTTPGIQCNSYTIAVSGIEYRRDHPFALLGATVGKCPNTLIGEVRLVRR